MDVRITKLRVEDDQRSRIRDGKSMARLWACSLAGHSWAYIREDTHAGQVGLPTCWLLLSSSRLGRQATNHLAPRLPSCSSACRRENKVFSLLSWTLGQCLHSARSTLLSYDCDVHVCWNEVHCLVRSCLFTLLFFNFFRMQFCSPFTPKYAVVRPDDSAAGQK